MITAGIDVGIAYTKAVVLKDGKVAGKACGLSGGAKRPANVQAIYDKALAEAGVKAADVEKVFATGKGKFDVSFADDRLTEVVTATQAAKLTTPKVTTVIDAGADEIVVGVVEGEKINEFVLNQKCAAGLGLFLESMAERFDMTVEELGALDGPLSVTVNEGCVVFAELDALSLANRGTDLKEIGKALNEACAWRASMTINDIYKQNKDCVVIMGGLVKNGAFLKALERIAGVKFVVPEEPVYAGAIGAASLAAAS
ncbi:MAG: acyl-CoA dehydratase activase [Clostridiales bacterium]|nr:acyl-CoA dehydratase activase [Clostridiales bacterium]